MAAKKKSVSKKSTSTEPVVRRKYTRRAIAVATPDEAVGASEAAASGEAPAPAKKRGGRPRKIVEAVVRRKYTRRAVVVATPEEAAGAEAPAKKRRGRPRKIVKAVVRRKYTRRAVAVATPDEATGAEAPAKKRGGRPRKIVAAVAEAPAKRRGRPPRAATAASAYAAAGVDIALGDSVKQGLKKSLQTASRPEVLASVGGFGGLFDLSNLKYKSPVLVSSVDGVGTKLKLAFETGNHECVGQDIVNHCVNDIAVLGAEPLFFLDYIGLGKLDPMVFDKLIAGMKTACQAADVALIGGETAQMPGFYQPGEYDLVGCIVGIVEKKKILSGAAIRPGDLILGMASNGLHTNGYSLARKIIFEKLGHKTTDKLPGTKLTFGEALLQPHVNYSPLTRKLTKKFNHGPSHKRKRNAIHGLCHITGGGFTGNLPRILPAGCGADLHHGTWPSLPIFDYLVAHGDVSFEELHEVFNMGIGMCLVVSAEHAFAVQKAAEKAGQPTFIIGEVTTTAKVRVVR